MVFFPYLEKKSTTVEPSSREEVLEITLVEKVEFPLKDKRHH